MSGRLVVGLALLVVRVAGRVVPRTVRREWREEWRAEILHWARRMEQEERMSFRRQLELLRRVQGAFADARALRVQEATDSGVFLDFRYGLRMLSKTKTFTLIASVVLALGIGANAAIFSVVNAVLLQPLPFRDPDRLVMIWERHHQRQQDKNVVGPANYLRWKERAATFDGMSAFAAWGLNVTGNGDPERVLAGIVSADFFQTLGIEAALGRSLAPEDGVPGAADVVLLSDGFWRRRFGGDPGIIGRRISVSERPMTIVGVLAPGFRGLNQEAIWVPVAFTEEHRNFRGRYLQVAARLKDGVSLDAARAEMNAIARNLERELPDFDAGWSVTLLPMHEDLAGDVRTGLLVLLGAVSLVLLIGCANVANLLLTRATQREKEVAIRAALGAGRGRLIRLLLVESLLLASLGGMFGLGVAYLGLNALLSQLPAEIPSYANIRIDGWVLAYTLLVSVATALVFGVAPALQSIAAGCHETLKEGGRASGGARSRTRQLLVGAEVALAMVLLVGAGLLLQSFARLRSVDPGFLTENVLTFEVSLSGERYREERRSTEFFEQVLSRSGTVRGVESAGAMSWLPLGSGGSSTSFIVSDRPAPPAGEEPVADVRVVAGDLFETLGIELLRGRVFDRRDGPEALLVVVVNETLARDFWPEGDPVGKRISMEWGELKDAEIIGVVEDIKLSRLDQASRPVLYWSQAQLPYRFLTFMLRTPGDPSSLTAALRREIAAVDPEIPLARVQTMERVVADALKQPRFTTFLLGVFATLALVLALVGVYGVVSYSVTQRTHEIGLRMALGARASDVLSMVLRQSMSMILAGILAGLAASFSLTRFLESLLFETPATEPATVAGVALLLAAVGFVACLVPARRATQADPVLALRYE
jgi:putative ABC transport system permease protein